MKKLLLASAIAGLTISAYADHHEAPNFTTVDANQDGMLGTQEAMTAFPDANFDDANGDSIVSISEADDAFEGLDLLAMLRDQNHAGEGSQAAPRDSQSATAQDNQQAADDQNATQNRDSGTPQSSTDHDSMELTGDSPVGAKEYQLIAQHLQQQEGMQGESENPATAQTSDNN